jgi:2-polyprenyl-3-methyl-5-hydroxy-6-metoxy-1,4-benzoquinol methylase
MRTDDPRYAHRLISRETRWWKRLLNVQGPYRWNLQRLKPGFVLDVGCGTGRNLAHLKGHGVGVDHNVACVQLACARGLKAFTPGDFDGSEYARPQHFDTLLLAHVVEHMTSVEAEALVRRYLPLVKPGGMVIFITPQEAGYASDRTHIRFVDVAALDRMARSLGIFRLRAYSFPFPRWVGRIFRYNEFVWVGRVPERM